MAAGGDSQGEVEGAAASGVGAGSAEQEQRLRMAEGENKTLVGENLALRRALARRPGMLTAISQGTAVALVAMLVALLSYGHALSSKTDAFCRLDRFRLFM
jgi:hypothetical protein